MKNPLPDTASEGLPVFSLDSPVLNRPVLFDFDAVKPLRAFYKQQYDFEIKRREEIFRLIPIPITLMGLLLAGNYGVLRMFPSTPIGQAVAFYLVIVSIMYCLFAGDKLSDALTTVYSDSIDPKNVEQQCVNDLALNGPQAPNDAEARRDALDRTLALLDGRYRDDASHNGGANEKTHSALIKCIHRCFVSACLLVMAALACVVVPVFEIRDNPHLKSASP